MLFIDWKMGLHTVHIRSEDLLWKTGYMSWGLRLVRIGMELMTVGIPWGSTTCGSVGRRIGRCMWRNVESDAIVSLTSLKGLLCNWDDPSPHSWMIHNTTTICLSQTRELHVWKTRGRSDAKSWVWRAWNGYMVEMMIIYSGTGICHWPLGAE